MDFGVRPLGNRAQNWLCPSYRVICNISKVSLTNLDFYKSLLNKCSV